tara:strand:- start:1559 stop:1798 length:240 start_codon:yes stop_codon:yes gene_type:complete
MLDSKIAAKDAFICGFVTNKKAGERTVAHLASIRGSARPGEQATKRLDEPALAGWGRRMAVKTGFVPVKSAAGKTICSE